MESVGVMLRAGRVWLRAGGPPAMVGASRCVPRPWVEFRVVCRARGWRCALRGPGIGQVFALRAVAVEVTSRCATVALMASRV